MSYKITATFPQLNSVELVDVITKKVFYYKCSCKVDVRRFKVGTVITIRTL